MDRDGLADFLRRRRAALRAEDLGIAVGSRRRTAGLRREEVAARARISTDFYTRLEQRARPRPSASTVASLAARSASTRSSATTSSSSPATTPPPTALRSRRPEPGAAAGARTARRAGDDRLRPRRHAAPEPARRSARSASHSGFSGPAQHDLPLVHRTRAAPSTRRRPRVPRPQPRRRAARRPRAARPRSRSRRAGRPLLAESEEFAALWERHEVARRRRRQALRPPAGRRDHPRLPEPDRREPSERLVVFSAAPGSVDEARLRMLAELAAADQLSPPVEPRRTESAEWAGPPATVWRLMSK